MDNLSLRLYVLLCTVVMWIRTWAQDDDEDLDELPETGQQADDVDAIEGVLEYQPVRFSLSDVLLVVLLLLSCYVFGKIWKGCSYLLLIVAAIFFYLSR